MSECRLPHLRAFLPAQESAPSHKELAPSRNRARTFRVKGHRVLGRSKVLHLQQDIPLITYRQLIPVSQPSALPEVTEQPSKNDEYAHLFNERFKSIRSQRPSSAGNDDDDETTWLENAMGNQGEDELEQIKPAKGKLTIQFGQR